MKLPLSLACLAVFSLFFAPSLVAQSLPDSLGSALGYSTAPASGPNVSLHLSADHRSAAPGQTVHLVATLDHAAGWNTYWTNPGIGAPTKLTWQLPAGYTAGEPIWPTPTLKPGDYGGSNIYTGKVPIVVPVQIPGDAAAGEVQIGLQAGWLECQESCLPSSGTASLALIIGETEKDDAAASTVADVLAQQPSADTGWDVSVDASGESALVATLTPGADASDVDPSSIAFFETSASPALKIALPQAEKRADGSIVLTLAKKSSAAERQDISGYFYTADGWSAGAPGVTAIAAGVSSSEPTAPAVAEPTAAPATSDSAGPATAAEEQAAIAAMASWGVVEVSQVEKKESTLPLMFLFALVGGVILNFMPCVFPVLGLKIMGFVSQAGDDKGKIRRHGFVFAIGVLVSLWALVVVLLIVRAVTGENVAWGFQLQNSYFLAFMISVMFVFGLNLSGLFELGTSLASAGSGLQAKKGYSGSFFSGVLAVLVASPCTGPFMGPAIGFALSASTFAGLGIFTALGVGLALPYVILSCFPALIQKLPKPGAWMETFKHLMAFPLYATAIWLTWVFGKITGTSGMTWLMFGLLIAAFGMWLYGRYATLLSKPPTKLFGRFAALAGLVGLGFMAYQGANKEAPQASYGEVINKYGFAWESFSPTKVVEHRKKGRTVFIDFTADW